jgi:hypothetical protein
MGAPEGIETRTELEEAGSWAGHKLDEVGGASVGRVESVYVDAESGRLEWLLVRMGRFGHHTLVPGRDAVEGVGHVWVPYARDQIRSAPKIEPGSSLNRQREQGLLRYYGIAGDAGRFAEIARREPGAITTHPVT